MISTSPAWEIILKYMEINSYYTGHLKGVNKWTASNLIPAFLDRKPTANIVVFGPYRSGKSTLLGKVVMGCKAIPDREIKKLETKYPERSAMEIARSLLDRTDQEMELSTIDVSRRMISFKTHNVNLIQVPGKPKFIKNRLAGITAADSALCVISACDFESDLPQIKDALVLARMTSIKSLLIAITKLDAVDSPENTFNTIKISVTAIFKEYSLDIAPNQFIPVSSKTDTNITTLGGYDWFKGLSLIQTLEHVNIPQREPNKPLKIAIDKVYSVYGVGLIIAGTVLEGIVFSGQQARISPIAKIIRIRSMHLAIPKIPIDHAIPGEYVALNVSGIGTKEVQSRRLGLITGYISPEHLAKPSTLNVPPIMTKYLKYESPYHPCKSFYAQMLIFGLSSKGRKSDQKSEFVFHCHNSQSIVCFTALKRSSPIHKYDDANVSAHFTYLPLEIAHLIFLHLSEPFIFSQLPLVSKYFYTLSTHPRLWKIIKTQNSDKPLHNKLSFREDWKLENMHKIPLMPQLTNGTYIVHIKPQRPLALDSHDQCPKLGRFVLREGEKIVGGGLILETLF